MPLQFDKSQHIKQNKQPNLRYRFKSIFEFIKTLKFNNFQSVCPNATNQNPCTRHFKDLLIGTIEPLSFLDLNSNSKHSSFHCWATNYECMGVRQFLPLLSIEQVLSFVKTTDKLQKDTCVIFLFEDKIQNKLTKGYNSLSFFFNF